MHLQWPHTFYYINGIVIITIRLIMLPIYSYLSRYIIKIDRHSNNELASH